MLDRLLTMIALHSLQSWAHFNMLGDCDFSNDKLQDNISNLPSNPRPGSFRKIGRRQPDENPVTYAQNRNACGTYAPMLG